MFKWPCPLRGLNITRTDVMGWPWRIVVTLPAACGYIWNVWRILAAEQRSTIMLMPRWFWTVVKPFKVSTQKCGNSQLQPQFPRKPFHGSTFIFRSPWGIFWNCDFNWMCTILTLEFLGRYIDEIRETTTTIEEAIPNEYLVLQDYSNINGNIWIYSFLATVCKHRCLLIYYLQGCW